MSCLRTPRKKDLVMFCKWSQLSVKPDLIHNVLVET